MRTDCAVVYRTQCSMLYFKGIELVAMKTFPFERQVFWVFLFRSEDLASTVGTAWRSKTGLATMKNRSNPRLQIRQGCGAVPVSSDP